MTIEELFGTLQQSVVAGWRKHLRTYKYSKHMALDEFYSEMPDKVDALIEAWMGANGKKVKSFTNVITSKNMGTLSYLRELRKVVKQGYALMGGENELEALLDDIVELIDSTLYKVKELNDEPEIKENKIDLKDFINESLLVEGNTDYAFVWNHYDASTLYCLNGATSKLQKDLKNYDYNIQMAKIASNVCSVMWNDEFLAVQECKGNNLKAVENNVIKELADQMTEYGNDETYKYFDCCLGSNEWCDDDAESDDPKHYAKAFFDMIKDSEVDGDSGYGRAIIDVKNGEVLLSGSVNVIFQTANEFLESITQE